MNDDFEKDIENSLEKFKGDIQQAEVSEEFKNKLEEKLKSVDSENKKTKNSFSKAKKWTVALASCFIIVTGLCFAGDFENVILKHFSNVDKTAKEAIEGGEVKQVDMDFVTDKDISIKADYVIMKDNNFYVALEVQTDKYEYDKILLDKIDIYDEQEYLKEDGSNQNHIKTMKKYYDLENKNIIFLQVDNTLSTDTEIYIEITIIEFLKDNQYDRINGNWLLEVKM